MFAVFCKFLKTLWFGEFYWRTGAVKGLSVSLQAIDNEWVSVVYRGTGGNRVFAGADPGPGDEGELVLGRLAGRVWRQSSGVTATVVFLTVRMVPGSRG